MTPAIDINVVHTTITTPARMPSTRGGRHTWMDNGNCINRLPETMFPDSGDRVGIEDARAICHDGPCPVLTECQRHALISGIDEKSHGVQGGLSADEQDKVKRILRARRKERATTTAATQAAA